MNGRVRRRIESACHAAVAGPMGWPRAMKVKEALAAAAPYIREELESETVLTLGAAIHAWRHRHVDAAVSVGPLECMPNKLAESQFFHVAEREGLHSLTLSLNGDPVDPEVLDNFAFEVHARFRRRQEPPRTSWVERIEEVLDVEAALTRPADEV